MTIITQQILDNDNTSGIGTYDNELETSKPNQEDINILINNPDLPAVNK